MNSGNLNAFPMAYSATDEIASGLSKREYFAACAMRGMIAGYTDSIDAETCALLSIKFAEALLKALENG